VRSRDETKAYRPRINLSERCWDYGTKQGTSDKILFVDHCPFSCHYKKGNLYTSTKMLKGGEGGDANAFTIYNFEQRLLAYRVYWFYGVSHRTGVIQTTGVVRDWIAEDHPGMVGLGGGGEKFRDETTNGVLDGRTCIPAPATCNMLCTYMNSFAVNQKFATIFGVLDQEPASSATPFPSLPDNNQYPTTVLEHFLKKGLQIMIAKKLVTMQGVVEEMKRGFSHAELAERVAMLLAEDKPVQEEEQETDMVTEEQGESTTDK